MLLFASVYVDGGPPVDISEQNENQMAAGVDIMVSALRDLAAERRSSQANLQASDDPPLPPSELEQRRGADMKDDAVAARDPGGDDMAVDDEVGEGVGSGVALARDNNGSVPKWPLISPQASAGTASNDGVAQRCSTATSPATDRRSLPTDYRRTSSPETPTSSFNSPRSSPPPPPPDVGYFLDKNFRMPGLTVPPDRILLATGRGASRRKPPPVDKEPVQIPASIVEETIVELSAVDRGDSLRKRLVELSRHERCRHTGCIWGYDAEEGPCSLVAAGALFPWLPDPA